MARKRSGWSSESFRARRVTRELRRHGWLVNHKRVARLMSQDNLLPVQPRAPQTDTSTRSFIMWEA